MRGLLIIIFFIPLGTLAQDKVAGVYWNNGQVIYDQVFERSGATQSELFNLCKSWLVTNFKDANEVIQYSNSDEGKIIGKGNSKCGNIDSYMHFTITMMVKAGKYRVLVSDITFEVLPSKYNPDGYKATAEELFLPENFFKKNGAAKPVHENYRNCCVDIVKTILLSLKDLKTNSGNIPENANW